MTCGCVLTCGWRSRLCGCWVCGAGQVLWRFFRLWALCDGIETVENMNRCVNNNYTLTGTWVVWCHACTHHVAPGIVLPHTQCRPRRAT